MTVVVGERLSSTGQYLLQFRFRFGQSPHCALCLWVIGDLLIQFQVFERKIEHRAAFGDARALFPARQCFNRYAQLRGHFVLRESQSGSTCFDFFGQHCLFSPGKLF